jgi:hypothetical protein
MEFKLGGKMICYCPLKVGSFMLHMQTRSSEHKSGAKPSVLIGSLRVPHFVKATASDTFYKLGSPSNNKELM